MALSGPSSSAHVGPSYSDRQGSKVLKKEESSQLCPTSWAPRHRDRDFEFFHGDMKKDHEKRCKTLETVQLQRHGNQLHWDSEIDAFEAI